MDFNEGQKYVRDYISLLIENCVVYDSREMYKGLKGEPAPPYDPLKRTKRWQLIKPPSGVVDGRFVANVLAQDAETSEVLKNSFGKPYLQPYSFSVATGLTVNIPTGVANEVKYPGPESWLPLRDLQEYEHLEFRSGLVDAGLLSVFSSFLAYLVDDRYRPTHPISNSEVMDKLNSIEEKIDLLLKGR